MKNNGSFYHITGPVSNQAEKVYPDQVFPFVHEGVAMFSHEEHPLSFAVTECCTGTCLGRAEDQEQAEVQAREIINAHAPEIRGMVKYIADMIEAGFEYDPNENHWNPIEPIEEGINETDSDSEAISGT